MATKTGGDEPADNEGPAHFTHQLIRETPNYYFIKQPNWKQYGLEWTNICWLGYDV
jgi:hypothetical protein